MTKKNIPSQVASRVKSTTMELTMILLLIILPFRNSVKTNNEK